MADAWEEFQALKSKRDSLKKKSERRKKELEELLNLGTSDGSVNSVVVPQLSTQPAHPGLGLQGAGNTGERPNEPELQTTDTKADVEVECHVLSALTAASLNLPADSRQICAAGMKVSGTHIHHHLVANLLQKFAAQNLISVTEDSKDGKWMLVVHTADHAKLVAMVASAEANDASGRVGEFKGVKRPLENDSGVPESQERDEKKKDTDKRKDKKDDDIHSLLSLASTREKESKKMGEEILELLSKPTAKEKSLAERFRSQGGAQVQEFCAHGTKEECIAVSGTVEPCKKLHFKKIIQQHTDEALGDCSFLNTCFHMDTCKYVHYEVDRSTLPRSESTLMKFETSKTTTADSTTLSQPQWVQCDLRYLDMTVLGKFAVVMADPPWDIHMELPYGTMSDDEMRQLNVPALQDDGLIFLWVTGRAMELGRECLELWGYDRVDEIIWVKTNQLQRIIRTGRTGHWLNHGKEHCLVGMKGNPKNINRGLDCDVIVAEVRATSHKPDEIYGIIERLAPGTRKIELFGRPHNVQPNWVTLGNQLDGVHLIDPDVVRTFRAKYPEGIVPSS